MSGSSRAGRSLSRCVVILDSCMNISWTRNPDGSYPGTKFHAEEEEGYRRLIDRHALAIEELFDEYAFDGRYFTSANDPQFNELADSAYVNDVLLQQVIVQVASQPKFTTEELEALARQVARILSAENDMHDKFHL